MINTDQGSSFPSRKITFLAVRFYKKEKCTFIKKRLPSRVICLRIGTFHSEEQALEYGNEIKKKGRDFKFYITLND